MRLISRTPPPRCTAEAPVPVQISAHIAPQQGHCRNAVVRARRERA